MGWIVSFTSGLFSSDSISSSLAHSNSPFFRKVFLLFFLDPSPAIFIWTLFCLLYLLLWWHIFLDPNGRLSLLVSKDQWWTNHPSLSVLLEGEDLVCYSFWLHSFKVSTGSHYSFIYLGRDVTYSLDLFSYIHSVSQDVLEIRFLLCPYKSKICFYLPQEQVSVQHSFWMVLINIIIYVYKY